MKINKTILSAIIVVFLALGMQAAKETTQQVESEGNSFLEFYCQYSTFTDPGDHEFMYEGLPDSLAELCELIENQTKYQYFQPKYLSTQSILRALHKSESSGLMSVRKPKDRLPVNCWHRAILLTSILRYKGIPARVRIGHAAYDESELHFSHVVCEVWNQDEQRWMLVDPSFGKVDFSQEQFDYSYEAWMQLQNNELDPQQYGSPKKRGPISIIGKVPLDLACILGAEHSMYEYSPLIEGYLMNPNDFNPNPNHVRLLNKVSELMKADDVEALTQLRRIYESNPVLQVTKKLDFEKMRARQRKQ